MKRLLVSFLCLSVVALTAFGQALQSADSGRRVEELILAITGATLIDGSGRAPLQDAVVVVAGGRIRAAGLRYRVAVPAGADGNLVVDASVITFRLSPISKTQFRAVNAPADINITFNNAEPGKPLLMRVQIETGKPMVFEAISPPVLTPAQLAEYVGDYYSNELQTLYQVALEDGKLFLRLANKDTELSKKPLQPSLRDAFSVRGLSLNFVRDGQGKISYFTVNAGRVKNIRFLRR